MEIFIATSRIFAKDVTVVHVINSRYSVKNTMCNSEFHADVVYWADDIVSRCLPDAPSR